VLSFFTGLSSPAGAQAADPPKMMAGLRSELVWQRTSPKSGSAEGPVLYQLIFRSSATPGNVPAIASNFTLTNSPISVTGSGIQVSGNVQTSGHFIGDGSMLTNLPGGGGGGTVTSVGLAAVSDFVVTGSPVTGSGTFNLNWNIPPTSDNTPNSIVKRDPNGTVSIGTVIARQFNGQFIGDGSQLTNLPVSGTLASVGLNSQTQDLVVSGSPITGKGGTLTLNWNGNVAPTSSNIVNTIVKRDSTGGFSAGFIQVGAISAAGATNSAGIVSVGGPGSSSGGTFFAGNGTGGNGISSFADGGGEGGQFIGGTNGNGLGAEGRGSGYGGFFQGGGIGIFAQGFGGSLAGQFLGDVQISGTLTATTKHFRIDHPLAPAEKYLVHAAVESSEVMNLYSGNVTLNRRGEAWVELPNWFEALNEDFRYVLTAIGAPGPNLYVAREIREHRFKIAGGRPLARVSWQVTGVRHDAYMAAHPMQVEEDKPAGERGHYLHPELFGQPEEKTVGWVERRSQTREESSLNAGTNQHE
jgi:hypothetical protein